MTIEAFEHMANTLRPQLVELCERFMANRQLHEEAEDMVQETLFRLWQMRGRLDSYQSPEALAVTIAKNVCIDRLRQQHMRFEPVEGEDMEDTRETDQSLIEHDTRRWIQSALNRLPAAQRRMLMMRSEGMTIDEISSICNTNKQSARTMISAARRCMLELLRKGGQQ
ncbi:MAG: RNA polymerase sigma factor [Bacteroidaceae bacterium]|nr:RNA polymerase sigma factor [Bacteroidaceae bacterium]